MLPYRNNCNLQHYNHHHCQGILNMAWHSSPLCRWYHKHYSHCSVLLPFIRHLPMGLLNMLLD